MKLRAKVIWITAGMFALLGTAQLIVQRQILLPSFAELERQAAKTDMDRVGNTITRELDLLSITARDYGNWIDTYQFMQERNDDYITINLTDDSISTLRVNVMAFIDPDGQFIWATGRQLETSEPINLDFVDAGGLPGKHPWRTAVSNGTEASGLLTTNLGAMLAVLAPVLDGQGHGTHRGMVLLGRLLTDKELARIGEQAQVKLSRSALPPSGPLAPMQSETLREHDTFTEVFRLLRDASGGSALMLRIEVPRTISASGARTVNSATLFLLGSGAIVLLLIVFGLNKAILAPLAAMTRHAVAIGQSDNLTSRLNLARADELGDLAQEFDRMVGRLAEARRQLVDQSFDAGIAENASGILHNLGNAMTPVSVKVACLKQSLQTAPTGDIEFVLAELAQSPTDAARKADLDEFLRLSSSELARVVTGALQDVESVERTTVVIQDILAEQVRHSRSGNVIETVELPELVARSAELVSPGLRQILSIEADESLHQLGAARLARTTIQQVLQNLIVNAAEAIRDARQERGSVRISARVMQNTAREQIDLIVTDNGPGISVADLPRIFEKGFSTKDPAANRGIGLHWCANAVNALGGSIRAESPGPNRGTTFHVVLPLERAAAIPIRRVA